jgi:hypothetical protein
MIIFYDCWKCLYDYFLFFGVGFWVWGFLGFGAFWVWVWGLGFRVLVDLLLPGELIHGLTVLGVNAVEVVLVLLHLQELILVGEKEREHARARLVAVHPMPELLHVVLNRLFDSSAVRHEVVPLRSS